MGEFDSSGQNLTLARLSLAFGDIRWVDKPCPKIQTLLVYHLIAANAAKLQDAKLMGNLVDTKQPY